ncbi:MFS transporter permease [Microbacterium sp. A588]
MWLRRALYSWLFPAAVVLPLWLLIGWGIFNAGGWAFLWVLFIAIPSVFLGQLVLTLLARARASVRETRMLSWWDVLGFGVWHALTIAVGFYPQAWFPLLLTGAIAAAIAMFWLMLWQLWNEARSASVGIRVTPTMVTDSEPDAWDQAFRQQEVIIVKEKPVAEP